MSTTSTASGSRSPWFHGALPDEMVAGAAAQAAAAAATTPMAAMAPEKVLDSVQKRCARMVPTEGRGPDALWLITGHLARYLLRDLPVHAVTFLDGSAVTVAITWEGDCRLLARVFAHEWCHAWRIRWLGLTSQRDYVRYLSAPVRLLYEELLALSVEKRLLPSMSWEDAAGFAYNRHFGDWNQAGLLAETELAEFHHPGTLTETARFRVSLLPSTAGPLPSF